MYELYIFDLDGTLIDSIGDIADALNLALAEEKCRPRRDEEVARMVGHGVHDLVKKRCRKRASTSRERKFSSSA